MSFAPPFAQAQVSLNGGAAVTGAQDNVPSNATVALTGVNTTGWVTALWEIYDYPLGAATPSGWTLQANGDITYNGTQSTPNPPSFTLPTNANWGKWAVRLTVNSGVDPTGVSNPPRMIDESMALSMWSPSGLHDGWNGELAQYGGALRSWTGDYRKNLRLLDTMLGGAGTRIVVTNAQSPYTVQPNTRIVVDPTSGVIINPAAGFTIGNWFELKVMVGKVLDASPDKITVNTLSGGKIEFPTTPGSYGAVNTAFVFNAPNQNGSSTLWMCDGLNFEIH